MLRRESHRDNVKRVYQPYREERRPVAAPEETKPAKLRQPKQLAWAINEIWSMDFVADTLSDGRKLRMLTVVECYTRDCLRPTSGKA